MGFRFVTVSRQFGSGGRTIGRKVAERLGIPCYDHEIIDKVSEESGFTKSYVAEQGEYRPHGILANAFLTGTSMMQDIIWITQRKIILDLAEKEPCVIVGRCADYILQERTDVLKTFIHADMKFRAERIVNLYGEQEDSPERRLKNKDKSRSSYYRYYTDLEWGNAANYHVSLDSGVFGIEKCVDLIVELYQS